MPSVTVYVNDKTYLKYLEQKEEINKKIAEMIKTEVNK